MVGPRFLHWEQRVLQHHDLPRDGSFNGKCRFACPVLPLREMLLARCRGQGPISKFAGRGRAHGQGSMGMPARDSREAGFFTGPWCLGEMKSPVSAH